MADFLTQCHRCLDARRRSGKNVRILCVATIPKWQPFLQQVSWGGARVTILRRRNMHVPVIFKRIRDFLDFFFFFFFCGVRFQVELAHHRAWRNSREQNIITTLISLLKWHPDIHFTCIRASPENIDVKEIAVTFSFFFFFSSFFFPPSTFTVGIMKRVDVLWKNGQLFPTFVLIIWKNLLLFLFCFVFVLLRLNKFCSRIWNHPSQVNVVTIFDSFWSSYVGEGGGGYTVQIMFIFNQFS